MRIPRLSTWPVHNFSLAFAKRFQFADLTCCSPVQHSDKPVYLPIFLPIFFLQTMSMHNGMFFHLWSCHLASEHFVLMT